MQMHSRCEFLADGSGVMLNVATGGRVRLIQAAGAVQDPKDPHTFELNAYSGGTLVFPGYDSPVVFDLASMEFPENTTQTPLLLDHKFEQPVGHSNDVKIDVTKGVIGTGIASVDSPFRERVVNSAIAGYEWQLSIGGTAPEDLIEFYGSGETVVVNNRSFGGPVVVVRNYRLREISFVSMGADQSGAVAVLLAALRSNSGEDKMGFEAWLKAQGIDLASLTPEGEARLRKVYDAEQNADDDDPADPQNSDPADEDPTDPADEDPADPEGAGGAEGDPEEYRNRLARVAAEETERNEALVALNARFQSPRATIGGREVSLLAHAQLNRWDADRFELECLRRNRPTARQTRRNEANGQSRATFLASMVYAVLSAAGVSLDREFKSRSAQIYLNANLRLNPNAEQRQRAMNAAHNYRHHSLLDLVAEAMTIDGIEVTAPKKSDQWFRAAFSSNSVQELFTQSTQAILLSTFEQYPQKLATIVREREVPNFKTNERKTVSPDTGEMERLNPTGTASDASLSAIGEEYKIARFAKRWGIDDQDMINEDLGVFEDMPMFLGASAARLFDQVIVKLLLTNPNLKDGNAWLSAGAGNLRTGSALTAANLKAALTAFSTQVDGQVNLDLNPNIALVPSALRFTLAEILNPAMRITGENATTTAANVLSNEIDQQIYSSLLDNGINDPDDRDTAIAGAADDWWLFDSRYPAIEVGHLQGTGRGPQIRTGTYSDGRYGVWFDVKRDIGAAPLRRESVQKNEA